MHEEIMRAVSTFFLGRGSGAEAARSGSHDKAFLYLVAKQLENFGYQVHISSGANDAKGALPGRYRPAKSWDIVARRNNVPVIAVEFKGQIGSLGNNENNRYEESIGCAHDVRMLFDDQICLGYLFVLGDSEEARRPNRGRNVPGIDPRWMNTSHAQRREQFCELVAKDGLYESTSVLYITNEPSYSNPSNPDLHFASFAARLHAKVLERGLFNPSVNEKTANCL